MNLKWSFRSVQTAACLAGALGAFAQAEDEGPALERNRLSVGARFSFGISADVQHRSTPLPTGGQYANGFVLPDVSGGQDGLTWNWGYTTANQIEGNTLSLSTPLSTPADGRSDPADEDMSAGFEVIYGRVLGDFKLGRRRAQWGVEGGFTSLNPKFASHDRFAGGVSVRTDTYDLNGIVPPGAPYAGTLDGPGPLIKLDKTGTSTAVFSAESAIQSQLDTLLVGFRLGPFVEVPVARRVQLNAGAGVAAVVAISDFSFTENVTFSGLPSANLTRTADASETDWLVGGYAQVTASYALSEFLAVYAGGQFQFLGDLELTTAGKSATLSLGSSVQAVVGLRASF